MVAAAAADLEGIRNICGSITPRSCIPIRKLYDAARSLVLMPQRGRIGQMRGTRELVLTPLPYIIVYGVEPDMLHVLRILHAARERR